MNMIMFKKNYRMFLLLSLLKTLTLTTATTLHWPSSGLLDSWNRLDTTPRTASTFSHCLSRFPLGSWIRKDFWLTDWHLLRLSQCFPSHPDDDVHRADVGLPIGVHGHHPDLDLLSGPIVELVRLDEGGETPGVEVELCPVGENLNGASVASDLQEIWLPVGGLVDLQKWNSPRFHCNIRFSLNTQV